MRVIGPGMAGGPRVQLPELESPAVEALLDRTGALVYAIDAEERVVSMNRTMRDRIDFDPETLTDVRALTRALYPEPALRETVHGVHRAALTAEKTREGEWLLSTRQGDQRQVRWQFVPQGKGDARVVVVIGEDITDRRKLEQWVRLQNAILERVPEAIVVADLDGRILHWSGAAEALFGYSPRSALERPLSNLIPDENPRAIVLDWVATLRSQGTMKFTRELRREKGDTLECSVNAARVQNERAQMVAIALLISPVTAPAAAAAAATDDAGGAEASPDGDLERALTQVAAVAVVVVSPDGSIRAWSRGAERLGGVGVGKARGKKFLDDVMKIEGLQWDGLTTRLAGRGRHSARVMVTRANGTVVPADLDAVALRGPDGTIQMVFCFLADRTEVQSMSEQARLTKERALVSVFTDGVVRRLQDACAYFEPDHRVVLATLTDLRTLSRMVAGGTSMREFDAYARRARLPDNDRGFDAVMTSLGEGVYRLRSLVDDINRFQASEPDPPGPVRLSRELEAARDLVSHAYENTVEIEFVVDDLPAARASRGPLLRGFCLLLLASAASCDGADSPRVTIEGKLRDGWLYLDVRDNGAGYAVDVQSRLGDLHYLAAQPGYAPLFLGLAKESLRAAGGTLELDTAAGTGTKVRVSFPAADAMAAVRPADMLRPRPTARANVLLVEDDELLRRALERHIGEAHTVDAYPTIADALAALPKHAWQAAVLAFPRPESFGLRLLTRFGEAAPALQRNAIVVIPPGLKHSTRERLVAQGCVVLTRPVDVTTLRSLLDRLVPSEEIVAVEGE